MSDVIRAEQALHRRAELVYAAAADAGVPGRFRVWDKAGLLAVSATDPALGFLSVVTGVREETLAAAIDLVEEAVWSGAEPAVVVSAEIGEAAEKLLLAAGFIRAEERLLAVRRLRASSISGAEQDVVDAGDGELFAQALLAGFEADGVVADFIRAEHGLPAMRRFLVLEEETPIAAGAMTIHGDVAVLGAASTLRSHRGKGAQSRLLRHRLGIAAQTCGLAVATARPGSVSAANLGKAGFSLHLRAAWRKSVPPAVEWSGGIETGRARASWSAVTSAGSAGRTLGRRSSWSGA